MTLSGEDERRRLIPVMKTMLQLTNEEILRLENCIKGKLLTRDVPQHDFLELLHILPIVSY